jgi:hypothetical protein
LIDAGDIIVTVNIFIIVGLLIYSVRLRRMFSSWNQARKGLDLLVAAAIFFLLASCVRWVWDWDLLPSSFGTLELGLRTFAFVLLFAFTVRYVQAWKKGY